MTSSGPQDAERRLLQLMEQLSGQQADFLRQEVEERAAAAGIPDPAGALARLIEAGLVQELPEGRIQVIAKRLFW